MDKTKLELCFGIKNSDKNQSKAIETIAKFIEDLRKWPKSILKYPQKNNNKEYLFYFELAGEKSKIFPKTILLYIFYLNKPKNIILTGPSDVQNVQAEFEMQLEERMKTVLAPNLIEKDVEGNDAQPLKRQKRTVKKTMEEETVEEGKVISKKKAKKRDAGLISFLNTYHKTWWTAKYNCSFAVENDEDEMEVCEEVSYDYNYW